MIQHKYNNIQMGKCIRMSCVKNERALIPNVISAR